MQKYEVMYHKIASEIKKLRKNAKLSQEDLAEKLNCSREFISRVENDKEKVSLKMIFTLSEVFNVSPKIFIDFIYLQYVFFLFKMFLNTIRG